LERHRKAHGGAACGEKAPRGGGLSSPNSLDPSPVWRGRALGKPGAPFSYPASIQILMGYKFSMRQTGSAQRAHIPLTAALRTPNGLVFERGDRALGQPGAPFGLPRPGAPGQSPRPPGGHQGARPPGA
jgi:hypothetical protein